MAQDRPPLIIADLGLVQERGQFVHARQEVGSGELILAQLTFWHTAGVFEEISRIELVIAEEFPGCAVQFVRTGLNRGIEDCGSGATELRAEIGSLHFELLHRVDRGENDKVCTVEKVDGIGIVVDAVEQVIVLRGAKTVSRESTTGSVAAGIGLAPLADVFFDDPIFRDVLKAILTDYPIEGWKLYFVYVSRKYAALKIRVFIDFLLELLSKTPVFKLAAVR